MKSATKVINYLPNSVLTRKNNTQYSLFGPLQSHRDDPVLLDFWKSFSYML